MKILAWFFGIIFAICIIFGQTNVEADGSFAQTVVMPFFIFGIFCISILPFAWPLVTIAIASKYIARTFDPNRSRPSASTTNHYHIHTGASSLHDAYENPIRRPANHSLNTPLLQLQSPRKSRKPRRPKI